MRIGFDQTSYTVAEGDESVTVCVNMTTGIATVPVSLETIDTGSAQGMHMYRCCLCHIAFHVHNHIVYVSATGSSPNIEGTY